MPCIEHAEGRHAESFGQLQVLFAVLRFSGRQRDQGRDPLVRHGRQAGEDFARSDQLQDCRHFHVVILAGQFVGRQHPGQMCLFIVGNFHHVSARETQVDQNFSAQMAADEFVVAPIEHKGVKIIVGQRFLQARVFFRARIRVAARILFVRFHLIQHFVHDLQLGGAGLFFDGPGKMVGFHGKSFRLAPGMNAKKPANVKTLAGRKQRRRRSTGKPG